MDEERILLRRRAARRSTHHFVNCAEEFVGCERLRKRFRGTEGLSGFEHQAFVNASRDCQDGEAGIDPHTGAIRSNRAFAQERDWVSLLREATS
jgi:hypothetical protein